MACGIACAFVLVIDRRNSAYSLARLGPGIEAGTPEESAVVMALARCYKRTRTRRRNAFLGFVAYGSSHEKRSLAKTGSQGHNIRKSQQRKRFFAGAGADGRLPLRAGAVCAGAGTHRCGKRSPSPSFPFLPMNPFFDDGLAPSLSRQILAFADSRRGMCSVTRRDTAGDGCGTQTPAGGAVRLTTRAALSHADWYPSVNTRKTDIIDTCCPPQMRVPTR